jgi:hypothetical protein
MPDRRPPNKAEQTAWLRAVTYAKIAGYKLKIAEARSHQMSIYYEWGLAHGETIETMPEVKSLYFELANLKNRAKKLKNILYAVHTNILELYFPIGVYGDIQIYGYPGMNEDEIAQYSLTGDDNLGLVIVITAGVLIWTAIIAGSAGTGLYFYIDHLQGKTQAMEERQIANEGLLHNKFCQNPESDECLRFLDFRTAQGYQTDTDYIDQMKRKVIEAMDSLGTGASMGISWAIPVVAGVGLIYFLSKRKK